MRDCVVDACSYCAVFHCYSHLNLRKKKETHQLYTLKLIGGHVVEVEPDPSGRVSGIPYTQAFLFGDGQLQLHTRLISDVVAEMTAVKYSTTETTRHGVPMFRLVDFAVAHFFRREWHFCVDVFAVDSHDIRRRLLFAMLDVGLVSGDFDYCAKIMNMIYDDAEHRVTAEGRIRVN